MARKQTLSPSKITTYLACPVKFGWTYLDPRGKWYLKSKSYYSFGSTLHKVLERFHNAGDTGVTTVGDALQASASEIGIAAQRSGTYLVMEGPQFSTKAESQLYRQWGCDVIGMTNMPEAKLAREAELCYATVAMVTDYDCWHEDHDHVTVDAVIKVLHDNAAKARALVKRVVPKLRARRAACHVGCHTVLDTAIVTQAAARDPGLVRKLDAVAGRVLR